MSDPLEAAWKLGQFFNDHNLRHVTIGGLAVQIWGEARLTNDADLTVDSSLEAGTEPIVRLITSKFESRVDDPVQFARQSRMILIRTAAGVDVDISLALPGYEDELFARAKAVEISPGKEVRICSPEDLIIHKAIAGRPQDEMDISSVVFRQREGLDVDYIRGWLRQFSNLLENPAIIDRFEKAWEELQRD